VVFLVLLPVHADSMIVSTISAIASTAASVAAKAIVSYVITAIAIAVTNYC